MIPNNIPSIGIIYQVSESYLMEFVNNLVIFSFLLLMLIPIFFVVYGIYHKIRYRKIYILRISFTLLVVILCSMYYIYCRYLDQQKVAYYCIDEQCISIVHLYKDYGINSPTYARIYAGKILFRFQVRAKNYAELLMEDDISISKKILGNKFIIYGSLPVIYGNVDNIEVKEATGYIDRASTDYIVSRNLKFRHLY